jgi:hypothetical protein
MRLTLDFHSGSKLNIAKPHHAKSTIEYFSLKRLL